jgi:hypothetical protein
MFRCLQTLWLVITLFLSTRALAQTALVQFIHNSPDVTLPTVDLWINGEVFAQSIDYLSATAMQPADTSSNAQIEIRNTYDSTIIYLTVQASLAVNSKNIFVLHGHLSTELYSPGRELGIARYSQALEISSSPSSIDVIFFQGATELDSTDIAETQLFELTAFEQLPYGSFSSYINLFTADYGWSILNSDDDSTLGEYALPVTELNWAGKAITIITGGFINQSINNGGQPLGMWATTRDGGTLIPLQALQWNLTANVQFLHNSSLAASEDIRIETDSSNWQVNIQTHEATSFLPFSAGKEVIMTIHSNLLESPQDVIWSDTLHLLSGSNYQLVWHGGSSSDNSPQLLIHPWEENEALGEDQLLLRLFNGSYHYDPISILADTISQTPLIENVTYSSMSDTIAMTISDEEWLLFSAFDSLTAFHAPVDTLNLWQKNVTALTFSTSYDSLPQLWLSTENGGPMHRLSTLIVPETPAFCAVQLIHASADTLLQSIDVWMNDSLMHTSISFESASEFFSVQCNEPIELRITRPNHPENILHRDTLELTANQTHRLILWGILNTPNYNPAPNLEWHIDSNTPLTSITSANSDIRFFHAATDLGSVQVNESSTPIVPFFTTVQNGEMSEMQSLWAQNDYGVEITHAPTQFNYGNYALPVNTLGWENQSILLISTGFRQPANNSGGEALELWALEPGGTMYPLADFVGVSASSSSEELIVFPNPTSEFIQIQTSDHTNGSVTIQIIDQTGKIVHQSESVIRNGKLEDRVPVENIPPGMYSLILKNDHYLRISRFSVR